MAHRLLMGAVMMNTTNTKKTASALILLATISALGLGTAGCSDPVEASTEPATATVDRVLAEDRTASQRRTAEAEPDLDIPAVVTPAPVPAPAPAPAVEPPAPDIRTVDGLTLGRLAVATGVEGREPIGETRQIRAGEERVYAFLELQNRSDLERSVFVTFERPDGTVTGAVELTVPANAPRWRTWAWSRYVRAPGSWRAVVRTPEGELVGRVSFEVVS